MPTNTQEPPHNATATYSGLQINIRYVAKRQRIESHIPRLFTTANKNLQKNGGAGIDTKKLIDAMGITTHRLNELLAGKEPTLGEAETFARFFSIELSKTFTTKK